MPTLCVPKNRKKDDRWKKVKRYAGAPRVFATPMDLLEACLDYFQWVEENPIEIEQLFNSKHGVQRAVTYKPRAMSLTALCIHIGIHLSAWADYRNRADYVGICSSAEALMFSQKLEGASADTLNQSIIARELGLAEKYQVDVQHKISLDDAQLAERIANLERKLIAEQPEEEAIDAEFNVLD